jgi:hypothetical protein
MRSRWREELLLKEATVYLPGSETACPGGRAVPRRADLGPAGKLL